MSDKQIYLNDEEWHRSIDRLKKIAGDVLQGHVGLNNGSVEIVSILHLLPTSISYHPAFSLFHSLASETIHLPLEQMRKNWNRESLIKADTELYEIEARYLNGIIDACQLLLKFDFNKHRFNLKLTSEN